MLGEEGLDGDGQPLRPINGTNRRSMSSSSSSSQAAIPQ